MAVKGRPEGVLPVHAGVGQPRQGLGAAVWKLQVGQRVQLLVHDLLL